MKRLVFVVLSWVVFAWPMTPGVCAQDPILMETENNDASRPPGANNRGAQPPSTRTDHSPVAPPKSQLDDLKDAAKLIGAVGAHVGKRSYSGVSRRLLQKICQFDEVWFKWKRDNKRGAVPPDGHKIIDGKKYPLYIKCWGNWIILNLCDWFTWQPGGAGSEGIGGSYDPEREDGGGGGGRPKHPPLGGSATSDKTREIALAATLYHEFLHCLQQVDPQGPANETHEAREKRIEREKNVIHAEIYRRQARFVLDAAAACEIQGADLDWLKKKAKQKENKAKEFDDNANR